MDIYSSIIRTLKGLYRRIKWWAQAMVGGGWSDRDLMSFDGHLAKVILPRLKRFKEVTIGHPSDLTEEQWDNILDKMISSFEFHSKEDRFIVRADWKDYNEGLELFAKYYTSLWY